MLHLLEALTRGLHTKHTDTFKYGVQDPNLFTVICNYTQNIKSMNNMGYGICKAPKALVAPLWVYGLWCVSIYTSIKIPVSVLRLKVRGWDESK